MSVLRIYKILTILTAISLLASACGAPPLDDCHVDGGRTDRAGTKHTQDRATGITPQGLNLQSHLQLWLPSPRHSPKRP